MKKYGRTVVGTGGWNDGFKCNIDKECMSGICDKGKCASTPRMGLFDVTSASTSTFGGFVPALFSQFRNFFLIWHWIVSLSILVWLRFEGWSLLTTFPFKQLASFEKVRTADCGQIVTSTWYSSIKLVARYTSICHVLSWLEMAWLLDENYSKLSSLQ